MLPILRGGSRTKRRVETHVLRCVFVIVGTRPPVSELSLLGSAARGEMGQYGDIDFLVDFLASRFGCQAGAKPLIRALAEARLIYSYAP